MQSEFVYAIESAKLDAIKIGIASNPNKRLSTIQSGNPDQLKIIGCWIGGVEAERQAHDRLKANHMRGEWFRKCDEVLSAIKELNQMKATQVSGLFTLQTSGGKELEIWEESHSLTKRQQVSPNTETINSRVEITDPELVQMLKTEQRISRLKIKTQLEALIEYALRQKHGQK